MDILRRDRAMLVVAIAVITGLAWGYVTWLAMAGMDMRGAMGDALEPAFRMWTAADFVFMFWMWAVMMTGMMTPSVAPMLLLYAAVGRRAGASGRPLAATGWFAAGYLAAWIGFSVAATGAQYILTRLALLTPMMASAIPSVVKIRRTSRARAPMLRRTPISRVRSSTFVVMALARPTMLIATITNPRTAIDVVSDRFAATSSRSAMYVISLLTS